MSLAALSSHARFCREMAARYGDAALMYERDAEGFAADSVIRQDCLQRAAIQRAAFQAYSTAAEDAERRFCEEADRVERLRAEVRALPDDEAERVAHGPVRPRSHLEEVATLAARDVAAGVEPDMRRAMRRAARSVRETVTVEEIARPDEGSELGRAVRAATEG